MYVTVVNLLSGAINGVNTDFVAPTAFLAGSARPVVNGVLYDPSDDQWGCTELDDTTVRMNTAPPTGYIMQLLYAEAQATGSPHHPSDAYT